MTLLLLLVPARGDNEICSEATADQCHEFYGSRCINGDKDRTDCESQGFPYFNHANVGDPQFLKTCNPQSVATDKNYAYRGRPCPGWNEAPSGEIVMNSAQADVNNVVLVNGFEIAASSSSTLKMIKYDTGATRKYLSSALKIAAYGNNIAVLKADNTIQTAKADNIYGISSPSYTVTAVADVTALQSLDVTDMSISKDGILAVATTFSEGSRVYFKRLTGQDATLQEISGSKWDVPNGAFSAVEFPGWTVSTMVWSPMETYEYPIIVVGGPYEGNTPGSTYCGLRTYSIRTGKMSHFPVPASRCDVKLAWSPDSLQIAVSYDGVVATYGVQPLGMLYPLSDTLISSQNGDITSLAWCPKNQKVVAGTSQGKILVHDFQHTHTFESGSDTAITGMDITSDGEYIVLANGAGVHTMRGGAVFTSSAVDDVITSASTTSTAAIAFAIIAAASIVALIM